MVLSETTQTILELQNSYNIKLIVLCILFMYSAVSYFIKDNIDTDKSPLHFALGYLTRWVSCVSFFFLPLCFMFLLKDSIDLEIFYLIVAGLYLLTIAVLMGVFVWMGADKTFNAFGLENWHNFKDKYKQRRSERKYG